MNKVDKFIKIFINILMNIILVLGITFIILFCCGIEPFVVETGSMEPVIKTGSLCFINKNVKYDDINENDIIAFTVATGNKVTHRVISKTNQGFETKGDANSASDGISTTRQNYIGKNIFSIPKLGYFVKIIQTKTGKIVLSVIIIIILLAGLLLGDKRQIKHNVKKNKGKHIKEGSEKNI